MLDIGEPGADFAPNLARFVGLSGIWHGERGKEWGLAPVGAGMRANRA